jgi:ribosomal-protein-alanine N-acetyltransferase
MIGMPPAPKAPRLGSGTVTLRPFSEDDIEPVRQMCSDPVFARWTGVPQPYTADDARRFVRDVVPAGWADASFRAWAVDAVDDDGHTRYAGTVDIRSTPLAHVGFGLHPWARGRGVTTRAVRLATRWALESGGASVVHWRSQVGNVPSRRVAWACGFTFGGTVPRLLHERGAVLDAWTGWLLPSDDGTPRTRWLEPVVLRGERVALRPLVESDAQRVQEACADERTGWWLPALGPGYSLDKAREYIASRVVQQSVGATVTWAVADPETDDLLGNISVMDLADLDPTSGEIGYWTHPAARGRGAMSEACRLVVAHAFAPVDSGGLGLRRLQIAAAAGNAASLHVADQAGFVEYGRARAAEPLGDGTFADLVRFDLLAKPPT